MKDKIVPLVLTLLLLVIIGACFGFMPNWRPAAFFSVVAFVLYVGLMISHFDHQHTVRTFENPYNITSNLAGMFFRVDEICGDRIGLVPFGQDGYVIRDLGGTTFYWIAPIPVSLRNKDTLIKVEQTATGLVFWQAVVYGFSDKAREPLGVIGLPLTA